MEFFRKMAEGGHEQVVFFRDKAEGKLRSIVAFHDTTLGPPLGGTRMYDYETEEDALEDALRLSKGMTLKSGAAGLNHGGAKGVIWGDPQKDKDEITLRAYGRFIEGLKGRFITGTDVGTYPGDFVTVGMETEYVVGLPLEYGGTGDTSILTAYGVFLGLGTSVQEAFGTDDLAGVKIAVQGVGKVGSKLALRLSETGADLVVSDIRMEAAQEVAKLTGARVVAPEAIHKEQVDVFSPNALGAILDERTIPELRCKVICGGANNQLATPSDALSIHRRGILLAPDYVVNAGGVIQVADELLGYDYERCKVKVERIPSLLRTVFDIAKREGVDTETAARQMVEERIERLLQIRATRT